MQIALDTKTSLNKALENYRTLDADEKRKFDSSKMQYDVRSIVLHL